MPDVVLTIPKTKGGNISATSELLSSDVHRRWKWDTTEVWPIGFAVSITYVGSVSVASELLPSTIDIETRQSPARE